MFDLYRRAAFIALGHPLYMVVLVASLLALGLVTVVLVFPYLLVGLAFVSLAQAHALREIRRRHGDLVVEAEEEISRL
jgi:predicted cation transporter